MEAPAPRCPVRPGCCSLAALSYSGLRAGSGAWPEPQRSGLRPRRPAQGLGRLVPVPLQPADPGSQGSIHTTRQTTLLHGSTTHQTPGPARAGATPPPDAGPWVGLRQPRPSDTVVCGPGFPQPPWASPTGSRPHPLPCWPHQGPLRPPERGCPGWESWAQTSPTCPRWTCAEASRQRAPLASRASLGAPDTLCQLGPHLTKPGPLRLHDPAGGPESVHLGKWAGPGSPRCP